MSRFVFGLPRRSEDDDQIVDSEDIAKAAGFSRGPKAQHKYWKRVPYYKQGKRAWKYYYNTPADKKRWMEERAKAIADKRAKLTAKVSVEDDHAHASEFEKDHPHLIAERKELQELTEEYLQELVKWDKPPNVKVSDRVKDEFHQAMYDQPDPVGKPMSPMRALELALNQLPGPLREHFSGAVKDIEILSTGEHPDLGPQRSGGTVLGHFELAGQGGNGGTLRVDFDSAVQFAKNRGARMSGGLLPVDVIVHEFAHAIHFDLGDAGSGRRLSGPFPNRGVPNKSWAGRNWHDWLDFLDDEQGINERGVTGYAETNNRERFAESFTAALLYPQQLALSSPRTYEWFRGFFGEEHMRPIHTDPRKMAELEAELAEAVKAKNPDQAMKLKAEIDRNTGVLDMDHEDPRLQWWKPPQTKVQKLLQDARIQQENTQNDYMDLNGRAFPDDKFYEMTIGGRTVYMRVGRKDTQSKYSGWSPRMPGSAPINRKKATGRYQLRKEEIKEIYDADGNPLTNDTARWYLEQDSLPDEPPPTHTAKTYEPDRVIDLANPSLTPENDNAVDKMRLHKLLGNMTWALHKRTDLEEQLAAAKSDKQREKLQKEIDDINAKYGLMEPRELSSDEFRVRSGTFGYDRWGRQGADDIEKLASPTLPAAERKRLEAKLISENPGVKRNNRGQIVKKQRRAGEAPVPVFHTLRYVNDNPDGTKTMIECNQGPDGRYYIKSPVWRQLLTPNGEHIRSADHLKQLCIAAARDRKRTWVSIKTDAPGDTEHFYHLELQFDGRGQPRILGDEWKRKLGKEKPRIDDLLTEGKKRPEIKAEKIRVKKPPKGKIDLTPPAIDPRTGKLVAGDPVVLKVNKRELGRVVKDPPTWDKLPPPPKNADGTITPRPELPMDERGKKQRLTHRERGLIKQGLLPPWFKGTVKQREWVRFHFQPAYEAWERSKEMDVQMVLTHVIPAKKAGEVPPPPRWDAMPMGFIHLVDDTEGKKGKMSAQERKFKKQGLLPAHYKATKRQKQWFKTQFLPAYKAWEETKDELTAQELPEQFIFTGAPGSGFPGRQVRRFGRAQALKGARPTIKGKEPVGLQSDILVYEHKKYHPVSGKVTGSETRVKLPLDGSVHAGHLSNLAGVNIMYEDAAGKRYKRPHDPERGEEPRKQVITLDMTGFHRLRMHLGGISLTTDAEKSLRARADQLAAAARRIQQRDHVIEIDDLAQIDKLAAGEVKGFGKVGLAPTLPNGKKFVPAEHQKELVQLTLDNDGRSLGAHYMGTGKTISAIMMAKLMMARTDPKDPSKPHPDAPKKTLIVAPLNTVEQWRAACFDFDDGCSVVGSGASFVPIDTYLQNVEKGHDTNDIVVVGPEYFTIHQEKLRKAGFDGLIVDEAHMGIKNETAARNEVIKEWNPDMKLLSLLTGTPITTSPVDILQYIQILSKGEQWSGMTKAQFENEYLEESPIPGLVGASQRTKVQIKPSKRAELAAIIAQYTHVTMTKDVRGKSLPATRIEENKHAHMKGTQALVYGLYMARTSQADLDRLAGGVVDASELGEDANRSVTLAKAISNCVGYKPKSDDQFVMSMREEVKKGGKIVHTPIAWRTFNPKDLMSRTDIKDKKTREDKFAGRWPRIGDPLMGGGDVGRLNAALYEAHFPDLFPGGYAARAGQKITKEELRIMKELGWPNNVANPDYGPVGIRARGSDTPRTDQWYRERINDALEFQQAWGEALRNGLLTASGWVSLDSADPASVDLFLERVAAQNGISFDVAEEYLRMRPDDQNHSSTQTYGGVTVEEGEQWFSDESGSLHLLYHPDDWDHEADGPKTSRYGEFDLETLAHRQRVKVKKKWQPKPPPAPIPPPDDWTGSVSDWKKKWKADWVTPDLTYDKDRTEQGPPPGVPKGYIALHRSDEGGPQTTAQKPDPWIWVPKDAVALTTKSLMDPGYRVDKDGNRISLRQERRKADLAMTGAHSGEGGWSNAKAQELHDYIQNFHRTTEEGLMDGDGQGRHGARQMVFFANSILDGCRTVEATLRVMGYKDVNEALEGSIEYDPDDPHPGNGKYFVTYIGSTYTGQRDLNAEIFKKMKDERGRDLEQSLFVNKTIEGRPWRIWPGQPAHDTVQMSQWLPEQRKAIKDQFKIDAPEAFYDDNGVTKYFYGNAESAKILREILLIGNPDKMFGPEGNPAHIKDPEKAEKAVASTMRAREEAKAKLLALQARYNQIVKQNAITGTPTDPDQAGPLSQRQQTVFNNCEMIVCSDAAQVGLNFGNAVEMVNYDSLGSPMKEWQRITRSARMLPPAIEEDLRPIMDKLVAAENEIFRPAELSAPAGMVADLSVGGMDLGTLPASEALTHIANWAQSGVMSARNAAEGQRWQRIMNRALSAGNLGTTAAEAFFEEMRNTANPAGPGMVLEYDIGGSNFPDPTEGTYDIRNATHIDEPTNAVRQAIDSLLDETEKKALTEAGFTSKGGKGIDAASLYLAIRAQQVMDKIASVREQVSAEMRSARAGEIVQDADVQNAIIDSLSPEDRAILKNQKYLVNVRRMGVSADVAQVVKKGEDNIPVFAGYAREHPIVPEQNTRARGRARMAATEEVLKAIQDKVPIRTELDYETTSAGDIGNMSLLDVPKKPVALGLAKPKGK